MSLKSPYRLADSELLAPGKSRELVAMEVREIPQKKYHGLFAREEIAPGQIVAIDGGIVVSSVDDVPPEKKYAVVYTENTFLAPRDFDQLESICFLNHHCGANVARIGGLVFVARKRILPGQEMTIDYAPLIAGVPNWTMDCLCGDPACRGTITGQDWRKPELAQALWAEWLPHVQRWILNQAQTGPSAC